MADRTSLTGEGIGSTTKEPSHVKDLPPALSGQWSVDRRRPDERLRDKDGSGDQCRV